MVGGDEEDVSRFLASVVDGLDSRVSGSDSLDGCIVDTGVTDLRDAGPERHSVWLTDPEWDQKAREPETHHVRWSKVAHDKLVLVTFDDLSYLVSNTLSAHLRLHVVSGDLG